MKVRMKNKIKSYNTELPIIHDKYLIFMFIAFEKINFFT